MAWIFSLWVEAETKPERNAIKAYFDQQTIHYNAREYTVQADSEGMVTVDGISRIGINSQNDADEMTAIGFQFYELLRNAPKFRYAMVGVEVDGFAFIDELREDPELYMKFKGLVIHKDLLEKLNTAHQLNPFSKDYFWNPYEGEVWSG